ncbi:alpha/beta fold hydrolase [Devosia ginsengisoli]|uniref:Alpha/beta fold hydrolase n=1 Tax=Devosia ginsengisoli TaxID=400770 RepID=A0A5B8LUH8_9HYPH|nr:alpha/beta hydrolase [Devosia ginsengisoli]QDZ11968.1 alpha/beta fold hydrolase [Devosia ginsengisoli]
MRPITRHFAHTQDGRRIHYRQAGSGPPLVLLHASPASSRVQIPLLGAWGGHFNVIALDTPGFGLSDPLPMANVEIGALADALADTLDALGLDRVMLYGRHTGGSIAVEFAKRFPARAEFVLTDGYTIVPNLPSADYLRAYLPPIEPQWDGGHLTWLWHRFREQFVFWPWNDPVNGLRADTDLPGPDELQRGVVELLEAGSAYANVYAAALRYRWHAPLAGLSTPVCFGVRPGDSQYRHADYLRSAGQAVEIIPRESEQAAARELEILLTHGTTLPPATTAPQPPTAPIRYVEVLGQQILLRQAGNGDGLPLLLLPAIPGASSQLQHLIDSLSLDRQVLAMDLPGNGYSDGASPLSVEMWARTVLALLDQLNIPRIALYGHNGGAAVAAHLATTAPDRVACVMLDGPPCLTATERNNQLAAFDFTLAPRWEGGHLLELWHLLRDQRLWWPWHSKTHQAIRAKPRAIDPILLHAEVRALVNNLQHLVPSWRAVLDYDFVGAVNSVAQPMMIGCAPDDVFFPAATTATQLWPDALWGDFSGKEKHASINAFLRGY